MFVNQAAELGRTMAPLLKKHSCEQVMSDSETLPSMLVRETATTICCRSTWDSAKTVTVKKLLLVSVDKIL
jgi:hypothetical protein